MNKYVILTAVSIIIIIGVGITLNNDFDDSTPQADNSVLVDWLHVHGLGLDPTDSSILYIATHGDFYQSTSGAPPVKVDKVGADYMGFNSPPIPGAPMYASGHPSSGGNTGLIKSYDGGRTWETVSKVLEPPVDFHTMAVSKSNPEMILGFDSAGRGLFKTIDSGNTWQSLEYPEYISSLSISPNNSELVFAGTGNGLYTSSDGGNNWTKVLNYKGEKVLSLAFDDDTLYVFSPETGIERSLDFGKNWEKVIELDFTVTSLVIDPHTKDIYTGGVSKTGHQEVYKLSSDLTKSYLIGTNRR